MTIKAKLLGVTAAVALIAVTIVIREVEAVQRSVGTVTYLKGDALRSAKAKPDWLPVKLKARLFQGEKIKTQEGARLEATLKDGSMLRLGESSEVTLQQMSFAKRKKKVRAKLIIGRIWASVTSLFGKDSEFEVSTENAVAGVRGTRFAAMRDVAGTTTVRVYSGKVLVSNKPIYAIEGHTKTKRVEVPGPEEISKDEWEELVAGAMQEVQIAADGAMTPAKTFAKADPKDDDWEAWNEERDKLAKLEE